MAEVAHSKEPSTPEDIASTQELLLVSDGFKRVVQLRERAQELRQAFDHKADAYDPLEALTIPGGSRMVSGFIGMVLGEVATELHADMLDDRADKLAQRLIGQDAEE